MNEDAISNIYKLSLNNLSIKEFENIPKKQLNFLYKSIFQNDSEPILYNFLAHNKLYDEFDSHHQKLKELTYLRTHQTMSIFSSSFLLTEILDKSNINFIFLKGIHLLNNFYSALDQRPIKDIDIFIDINQVQQAINVLLENGYSFEDKSREGISFQPEIGTYDIPNLIGMNGERIEIHYSIENYSISSECIFSKSFFDDSVYANFSNNKIRVLCNEDLLLHLIYHGFKKQGPDVGLFLITDINMLLTKGEINTLLLIKKAKKYKLIKHLSTIVYIFYKHSKEDIYKELNYTLNKENIPKHFHDFERLLVINCLNKNEVKIIKLFEKKYFLRFIGNYKYDSLSREFNKPIPSKRYFIIFSIRRFTRQLKDFLLFFLKSTFIKSYRNNVQSIKNILEYIEEDKQNF